VNSIVVAKGDLDIPVPLTEEQQNAIQGKPKILGIFHL